MTKRDLLETGQQIREMRLNRGLSPEQLALHLAPSEKVSGRTIRRIEQGARPTVRTMFSLAQYFNLDVTDLWPV